MTNVKISSTWEIQKNQILRVHSKSVLTTCTDYQEQQKSMFKSENKLGKDTTTKVRFYYRPSSTKNNCKVLFITIIEIASHNAGRKKKFLYPK